MDRVYVALDVETTGFEAGVDEIIEIGAVKFRRDEVLEHYQQFIKPRHSLPLKITRLTGISEDDLADAPRFAEVAPDLVRFVKSYPLVGHSIGFDLRMLQAQGMRFPQPAYDTFDLATLLMSRSSSYQLSALANAIGAAHGNAHRAGADADMTRQLFVHLLDTIDRLSLNDLGEIIKLTARLNWPARDLFEDAQKAKAKLVFVESAIATEKPPEQRAKGEWARIEPLKPRDDPHPIDVATVRRFFAPDGPMGRMFPGYEQRPEQVEMAVAVAEALNDSTSLVIEAGTGVGKSVSYLIPSALHATQRGERVVVSTNTINLQDQLFFKDIPDLQRIMGDEQPGAPPFTAALLKGRSNYLCLRRYKELRKDGRLTDEETRALLKVQLWLPNTTSGDKAELMLMEGENSAWSRMNVSPETCTGPRCPDFNDCFFFKARREAEAAHVLVVNHALLLADLAVEANVLPPYDHLVVDEAHNLEDVATDQLGFSLDQARLLQFLDDLFADNTGANLSSGLLAELPRYFQGSAAGDGDMERASDIARALGPTIARGRNSVYDVFNRLAAFMNTEAEVSAFDPRLRLTSDIRGRETWSEIVTAWENLELQLAAIGEGIGRLEALLADLRDAELLEYDALLLRVQSLKRFAVETRISASYVIFGNNEELITWLVYDRARDGIVLHAAPLSVAELLRANLFTQKATSVLASATLTIDGSFEYVEQRIGMDEPIEVQLESPFDYRQQALVYIPNDIPEPNQHGYQRALEETLIALCTATNGRALVLFTANSALRQTYRAIQEPLEDQGITVLGQGLDGSRRALLQRFKEFPNTVLLGTTSFWEGVDVVGDALSLLVIAKLPFSVPNDPVFAARSEQFKDAFSEFSVPQAILRFKQGFGRLIRSRSDRGVIAVLDRRLLTKKYGQTFLDSLPHTTVRAGSMKHLPALAARFLAARDGDTVTR